MDEKELQEVKKLLISQKPLVRAYWKNVADVQNMLASGEVVVAWTFLAVIAPLRKAGIDAGWVWPKEGALGWSEAISAVKGTKKLAARGGVRELHLQPRVRRDDGADHALRRRRRRSAVERLDPSRRGRPRYRSEERVSRLTFKDIPKNKFPLERDLERSEGGLRQRRRRAERDEHLDVRLRGVVKRFGDVRSRGGDRSGRRTGAVRHAPRPSAGAARPRRCGSSAASRQPMRARSWSPARRVDGSRRRPAHAHGVPELRALPASDGARRTSPSGCAWTGGRRPRSRARVDAMLGRLGLGRPGGRISAPALRRPAAARRARPRARDPSRASCCSTSRWARSTSRCASGCRAS